MLDVNNTIPVFISEEVVKRGRGRPKKEKLPGFEEAPKRPRGRPRKEIHSENQEQSIKRARGRPRKYPILGKEKLPNGEMKPVLKKVESGFLLKHMFAYFTKLLIIHQELSKESSKNEVIFKRLKLLDFQMVEVCKTILTSEYQQAIQEDSSIEKNELVA
ncbi:MAG: hypothetical protein FJZ59_02705 [Chlamydiae bacterium]|jgi:hypothetical protein|nr:hypothetical protein [Chlamydiota bacterium]